MKKIAAAVLIVSLLGTGTGFCQDSDLAGKMFMDSIYGGLIGTMVGGALMLLTDKPEDHVDNLRYGAAIGVLSGLTYAVADYSLNSSVAEIEDGKVKLAFPTLTPQVIERDGTQEVRVVAQLVKGRF